MVHYNLLVVGFGRDGCLLVQEEHCCHIILLNALHCAFLGSVDGVVEAGSRYREVESPRSSALEDIDVRVGGGRNCLDAASLQMAVVNLEERRKADAEK